MSDLNFFEQPSQICYCVPNGQSSCAPCRERRAAALPVRPPLVLNRLPPLPKSWVHAYAGDRFIGVDLAKGADATWVAIRDNKGRFDLTEGYPCPDCQSRLEIDHRLDGCSCHINPPCGYCTENSLVCTDCGLEIDYEDA